MTTFILPDFISDLSDMEKTDDDGVLQIYSYKTCTRSSSAKLKASRGLVFSGINENNENKNNNNKNNKNNPIFRSIGYTQEYSVDDVVMHDLVERDGSYLTFLPSTEGTLLRVFYHSSEMIPGGGKWYISTHRKLNAYDSRWGSSESFGQTFDNALAGLNLTVDGLLSALDRRHVYLFFVSTTPGSRMVSCAPAKPTVAHTATLLNGTEFTMSHPSPIPPPTPIVFSSVGDMVNFVNTVNITSHQGIIAFYPDGRHFKVLNGQYQLYSHARGNEASVMFRYLQVRNHPIYGKMFNEMYPERINEFISYENAIFRIAKSIHASYISRFVEKKETVVSQEEYRIIRLCHGWHIANRLANKVTMPVVLGTLSTPGMEPTLNTLIKRLLRTGTLAIPGMTLPPKKEMNMMNTDKVENEKKDDKMTE